MSDPLEFLRGFGPDGRLDHAWGDARHSDAELGVERGEGADEAADGVLCRSVDWGGEWSDLAGYAGDVDD